MNYEMLKKQFLPKRDGWNVLVRFTDAKEGIDQTKLFFEAGKTEPTLESITDHLSHLAGNIEDRIAEANIKTEYTKDEIEELLRAKGYLTENQTLEDLPDKVS